MSIIQLYNNLVKLADTNDAFYYKDFQSVGGGTYRLFSYHLASYTDFSQESALEARGSLWEIRDDGTLIRIAARPNKKFFNAYENPFVMYPKEMLSSEIEIAMDKRDGSIISTFMDSDNVLRTKSNASLHSEHAYNSTAMIHADSTFLEALKLADEDGYTVNMEYTSPEFRIVLPYQEEKLVVLNLRHRHTGEVLLGRDLEQQYPIIHSYSIFGNNYDFEKPFPMRPLLKDSIEEAYKLQDIEGFVLMFKDGSMCKVKTEWYCSLHFTRDSIMIDSRLYEVILQDASDDLKQMFSTDPACIQKIEKMENLIFMCYNKLQADVERFYEANKHLDRKAYALAVQNELSKELNRQGLAFALYNGKPVDYKEAMRKYMKDVLADF